MQPQAAGLGTGTGLGYSSSSSGPSLHVGVAGGARRHVALQGQEVEGAKGLEDGPQVVLCRTGRHGGGRRGNASRSRDGQQERHLSCQ